MKNNRLVVERLTTIEDADRSFDIDFWQAQDTTARFSAAWEMAVFAHRRQGKNDSELRLQRTIESLKRRES